MSPEEAVAAYNLVVQRWSVLTTIQDRAEQARATIEVRQAWAQRFADLFAHAEEGGPELWHALGSAFRWGHGVERKPATAQSWFERAATAGHIRAMVALALCKKQSDNPTEREVAVEWLRKAADLGDGGAMWFLGSAYREGQGVDRDYEQAIAWFLKAAEAGHHSGWISAAGVYDDHLKMPERALPLLRRAAELGLTDSYSRLGSILERRGTPVSDPIEAAAWYEKMADLGGISAPRAMMALAQLARSGNGRTPDPATARKWLLRICSTTSPNEYWHKQATDFLRKMDGELL